MGQPGSRCAVRAEGAQDPLSNIILSPFRMREASKWAGAVEQTEVQDPPIFIIGTWRSGTTYLHNLMARDPGLGYVSTRQAFCPERARRSSRRSSRRCCRRKGRWTTYRRLRLPGFEAARLRFEEYAASLDGYEKNHYEVTPEDIERVGRRWGFAIERLGYSIPDEILAAPIDEKGQAQ